MKYLINNKIYDTESAEKIINYLEENKQMCKYCNADYYIETKTNIMPAYGTLEEVAKAVNGQIHKTRVNFARVSINYCPMCGRKLS